MTDSARSKFPETLQLKVPRGTNVALDEAAARHHQTKSELARQAILRDLTANRVELKAERAA